MILDPTIGSGTTIEAAERTGRNSIGIEKDRDIFETAKKRIEGLRLSADLLVNNKSDQAQPGQQDLFDIMPTDE